MVAGKDMKFEFSGDDDVWVFIDGVLVGDLGGVHGAASLSINFKTGEVKLGDARKNPNHTWGGKETTLRACFEEALGKEKAAAYFKEDTNAFLPGSYHTLKFFYLERGNTDSNMKLMFNLQRVAQSTIRKDDQYGAPVPGAQFALFTPRSALAKARRAVHPEGGWAHLAGRHERGGQHQHHDARRKASL